MKKFILGTLIAGFMAAPVMGQVIRDRGDLECRDRLRVLRSEVSILTQRLDQCLTDQRNSPRMDQLIRENKELRLENGRLLMEKRDLADQNGRLLTDVRDLGDRNRTLTFEIERLEQRVRELEDRNRPTPPPFPGGDLVTVSGTIENQDFLVDVADAIDFQTACVNSIANRVRGSIDEGTISVNFGPKVRVYKSQGYFSSLGTACANLAIKAVELGLPANTQGGISVQGAVEGTNIEFKGFTKKEIMLQCMDKVKTIRGSIDEFDILVDGSRLIRGYKSNGYWGSAGEVCSEILSRI